MAFKLLGFKIGRDEDDDSPVIVTPVTPVNDDGAIILDSTTSGLFIDMDFAFKDESQLIIKYRQMAMNPEMENAINDIIDEAIVHDSAKGDVVGLNLDNSKLSDGIKTKIVNEFNTVLKLLNFNKFGDDVFRKWYVDGRLYYFVAIDEKAPSEGIKALIGIDPKKIKKYRQIRKDLNREVGAQMITDVEEYYVYNDQMFYNQTNNGVPMVQQSSSQSQGVRISPDSIVYTTSGIYDPIRAIVLGHLHKAIRPLNQLRFMEDSTVIYKTSRAPERRVFYVDVAGMNKTKAEQHMKNIMTSFRNKITYNADTGEIIDARRHISMLEDYWLPRRDGNKSTEVTTLPGGSGFGDMTDVEYFAKKLYDALGIPRSRLDSTNSFSLGKSGEITRDELKYAKFIQRLQNRFSILFDELLKRQLTLKGVCNLEEWEEIKQDIFYVYNKDNNYEELKESELLNQRLTTLTAMTQWFGAFFSREWAFKNVLKMDDVKIKEMLKQIEKEGPMPLPPQPGGDPNAPQQGADQQQQPQEADPKDAINAAAAELLSGL